MDGDPRTDSPKAGFHHRFVRRFSDTVGIAGPNRRLGDCGSTNTEQVLQYHMMSRTQRFTRTIEPPKRMSGSSLRKGQRRPHPSINASLSGKSYDKPKALGSWSWSREGPLVSGRWPVRKDKECGGGRTPPPFRGPSHSVLFQGRLRRGQLRIQSHEPGDPVLG